MKNTCICVVLMNLILINDLVHEVVLVRIANQMVMDRSCRGGIVRSRDVCSRAPSVPPERSKALWRFRVSTSNSLSGRSRPHAHTPMRYIHHIRVQQDIRVYEGDHFEPPMRQLSNPKVLWLLRVSI